MAKKKQILSFVSVEYTDGLVSAAPAEEINPTDERVKILDSFEDIKEAKKHAQQHAEKNNLNYKF